MQTHEDSNVESQRFHGSGVTVQHIMQFDPILIFP